MFILRPAIITFPDVPSKKIRECMKEIKFVYNPKEFRWYGRLQGTQRAVLECAFRVDRAKVEWREFRRVY
jgi:hypothetical protein